MLTDKALQLGCVESGHGAGTRGRFAHRRMFVDEVEKMPVDGLEDGFAEQVGLGAKIAKKLRFGDIGLARDLGRGCSRVSVAFEFLSSGLNEAIEDVICRATRAPHGGTVLFASWRVRGDSFGKCFLAQLGTSSAIRLGQYTIVALEIGRASCRDRV